MIFSSFFKAKWQHNDANVRLSAIAELLSADNAEQQSILKKIAQEDPADNVRKAALLKINDLNCYAENSQHNTSNVIKTFASKQIEKQLLEQNTQVPLSFKQQLLSQPNKVSFADAWLLVEQDMTIVKALYQKIAKPNLLQSLFAKKQDEAFQLFLLEEIQELALLEKLQKKATLPSIINTIKQRIERIKSAQEKPLLVKKQAQLVLSKLLSLKDQSDYEKVLHKRETLTNEWQQLSQDMSCLPENEQQILHEKYADITGQLERAFVVKAEQYEQMQIAQKAAAEKTMLIEQLETALADLNQQLANNVFENGLDESVFKQTLTALSQQLDVPILSESEKERYLKQINQQARKLEQLPIIAQSVTEATHLISKISQVSLPTSIDEFNEKLSWYEQWKQDWHQIEIKSIGALPDSIKNAHQEITQQWQAGLSPFYAQQKQQFEQARKNSFDVKRLLNQGKYNACFGVFKKFKASFELLSEKQKQRLQRDYDNLHEKINELADWEHYIATPRKQQLLNDVQALVESPLDNPNEQAKKVKEFRAVWNSLGHADEALDKALNEQFNDVIEKAFAPCRLFYAEQEKTREQHAAQRKQIIARAKKIAELLDEDEIVWKKLDTQLNKITQSWRDAGEIERNLYKQLQQEFNNVLQPVKTALHQYRADNIREKEQLIVKAQNCLALEDAFQAAADIKPLQVQWKEIGYAGPQQETKLWQRFRKINDEVFAKRNAEQHKKKATLAESQHVFDQALAAQLENMQQATTIEQLQICLEEANALYTDITDQKPVLKSSATTVEKFIKQIETNIQQLRKNKEKQHWQVMFSILAQLPSLSDSIADIAEFSHLPINIQKKLQEVANKQKYVCRREKTLEIEILGGLESPTEFAEQRLSTQVALMQQQMLSGNTIDLQKTYWEWLLLGAFTEADLSLLERIKPLYL